MQVLNVAFGYNGEYNLDMIFAMNQYWGERYLFNMQAPRPTSALLYVKSCELEYTWENGRLNAQKGEIVYLPQGSVYKTKFIGAKKDKISTVLVEFILRLPNGEPFVFGTEPTILSNNTVDMSEYFAEMVCLFNAPISSPSLKRSVLYKMLSVIGYEEKTAGLLMTEFAPIAKGIMYMENDMNQEKSISQIAEMCHVSPSYFRKLFKKYSGLSPIEYQIQTKMSRAKELIMTNTMQITEISYALGFFDASYFCKLFKKHVGLSPKEYKKSLQSHNDFSK